MDNEDIEKENIENQQNLIEQEKQQQQPTTTEKITENQTSGKNISFSFLANPTIIEKKSSTEADKGIQSHFLSFSFSFFFFFSFSFKKNFFIFYF